MDFNVDINLNGNRIRNAVLETKTAHKATLKVGGIEKNRNFPAGTTIDDIVEALISPYVAFDFSVTGTAAAGTFEYGTKKKLESVLINITAGSKAPTSLKISKDAAMSSDNVVKTVSNPTNNQTISLKNGSTLLIPEFDGTADKTIYLQMTDGTNTVDKTLVYNFRKYIYCGVVSTKSKPTTSSGLRNLLNFDGDGEYFETDNDTYLVFLTPTAKTQIQQYDKGSWVGIPTESAGKVNFTTSTNQTLEYFVYFSNKMASGKGNFQIV